MKDIDEILDAIKDKALNDIKKEFKDLLEKAQEDSVDLVKEVATNTARWLSMKAEGQLSESEARTLLKSQKKLAQVFVNTQAIKARVRTQRLAYRMLDIAIDVLVAAV